jgi:proteasome activator subunit 4
MLVCQANIKQDIEYDQVEWKARETMGKIFDRRWFDALFRYMKQEPRADEFRVVTATMLRYVFELMIGDGLTAATSDDIKELAMTVYGDGSDKHQHRATAEILGALISSITGTNVEKRAMVWEFVFRLTPENLGYWLTFLRMIMKGRDPRRSWPIIDHLASFRLDMSSNAASKESSKIYLLHQGIFEAG